jgi:hypothetical protein
MEPLEIGTNAEIEPNAWETEATDDHIEANVDEQNAKTEAMVIKMKQMQMVKKWVIKLKQN